MPKVINLQLVDMGQAYDFTQCGPVDHGDVLLVADGVAVLDRAWPVMVAGESEVFHHLADGVTWSDYLTHLDPGKADRLAAGVALATLPVADLVAQSVDCMELELARRRA